MVYVIAELRNYRQLAKLRAARLPGVEAGLAAALGSGAEPVGAAGPGMWISELGSPDALDVHAAAAAACRARDFLASQREALFGFAVIIASLPSAPDAGRAAAIRRLLDEADDDDNLWVASECALLFGGSLALEGTGLLSRARGEARPPAVEEPAREPPRPWVRGALVGRMLDLLCGRLNSGESRQILLVHGSAGVGKTAVIAEMAERLLRGSTRVPALHLRTIFKRRSPLHPFLSSLLPVLIDAVPGFLRGPERAAWEEVGGLLAWLEPSAVREPSGEPGRLPDHVLEDFSIGYRLYLTAWVRMAEEHLLPALLICEGVESYHPAARRIVARLLEDFLVFPAFIPVIAAVSETQPEELSNLELCPLYVHPLGKREIRSLARHLYPGLEMPESLARRLRRGTGGLHASVVSYLRFLAKTGSIREVAGRYEWGRTVASNTLLPASPISVSWYLIRTLSDAAFPLLYALHLAGGLLDREGFLSFLEGAGFEAAAAGRALAGFLASGLIAEERTLIPRFPEFRRKLEELLGGEAARVRNAFITHLVSLWESGRYRHPVLLFSFLARHGRTDLALRILPLIIRRKLDENDVAGARAFLDPRAILFSAPPTPEEGRELAALTAVGRLRAALLDEEADTADDAQAEAQRAVSAESAPRLRGEMHVERAKFLLSTGSAAAALEELKRGLLFSQETGGGGGGDRGERLCYLWLGVTMLADGRLRDAAEYLGLSQRLCHEVGDTPGGLWTQIYLAICRFVEGAYTRCLSEIERGFGMARAAYRREVELFLLFLKARILFQVGSYEECSLCLQACLCTATLYSMDDAMPVLRAWLGRTLVHRGERDAGIRLLETLDQTREVLLFQAEGALFSGGLENASLYVERALGLPDALRFSRPEVLPWRDGLAGVEGRCFRLGRGDAFLRRTLLALRAYLLGVRGFSDEGIRELRQLTRGEKTVEEDPAVAWCNYLYSRVLPETASEEVDDKLTILAKALKILQERASRIDAPAERSSFLWQNTWNRMIMEEARERKLV